MTLERGLTWSKKWHIINPSCLRSVGVKTASVALPTPTHRHHGSDDENGYVEWSYPYGSIAVTDDGTIMWGQWHITDPQKIRDAAAALLAAAETAAEVGE